MSESTVSFIGGGNMTRAIATGLIENGLPAGDISIAEPSSAQREMLANDLPGVFLTADNDEAMRRSDCTVLAVKPQIIAAVCRDLRDTASESRPLIVSIAAGPRIADIDDWLGGGHAIVRVMPNQPALLRAGISGLFANPATSNARRKLASRIMGAVGPVVEVAREEDIDAVTAVSGSGPAYVYLLIDMLAEAGKSLGLDAADARRLAQETVVGAGTLARASDESMQALIARVRSPGGTTAAALDHLESNGIRDIFAAALTAARDRATALADAAHESGKT